MRTVCINASPKKRNSTSAELLNKLDSILEDKSYILNLSNIDEYDDIKDIENLIIAFPLYVDGIPSHLLDWMKHIESIMKNNINEVRVYIIINCGFIEPHQNRYAIEIMKNWCKKSNLTFYGGIALGGGGMTHASPIGKGPNKNIGKALEELARNIKNKEYRDIVLVKPNFPRFLYIKAAHIGWKKQGKKNGLEKRDLYRKCD